MHRLLSNGYAPFTYDTPPRPMVYNQTYTEAFHVPFIMYDSSRERKETISSYYSNMDAVEILKAKAFETGKSILPRKNILCEYGGPGCPIINSFGIHISMINIE